MQSVNSWFAISGLDFTEWRRAVFSSRICENAPIWASQSAFCCFHGVHRSLWTKLKAVSSTFLLQGPRGRFIQCWNKQKVRFYLFKNIKTALTLQIVLCIQTWIKFMLFHINLDIFIVLTQQISDFMSLSNRHYLTMDAL